MFIFYKQINHKRNQKKSKKKENKIKNAISSIKMHTNEQRLVGEKSKHWKAKSVDLSVTQNAPATANGFSPSDSDAVNSRSGSH